MNSARSKRAPSPCCLGDLAEAYPDSDVSDSPLVSCNSSSERADSLAANDAFDAAVDSQIQMADDAAAVGPGLAAAAPPRLFVPCAAALGIGLVSICR